MPSAVPSRARLSNVLDAVKASGYVPGRVVVNADGSFSVEVLRTEAKTNPADLVDMSK